MTSQREQIMAYERECYARAVRRFALDCRVLAVAKVGEDGWRAYIGAVPGLNHDDEWEEVLRHGAKLPEAVALAIFPEFAGVAYAR